MRKQKGFTLIELLIVIAIIGLLATLAIVSLTSAQQRARDTKRVADVKALQTALELYYNKNASYPVGAGVLASWDALGTELSEFVSSIPVDPTNDAADDLQYKYLLPNAADPSSYVVSALLEDTNHDSLAQDYDVDSGTGAAAVLVRSADVTVNGAAAGIACSGAGVYCLQGQASP